MFLTISGFSSIIPFVAGIAFFRFLQKDRRLLAVFFGIAVLFDLFLSYTGHHGVNNLWAIHIWTLIEYGFLVYVFSYWHKNKAFRRLLRWSIPVFVMIWVAAKLGGIEDMTHFQNYTRSVGSMILTVASVIILYSLSESVGASIHKSYQFWVSLAVLIYFAGNIILFSASNIVLVGSLFFMHSVLNIIANLMYAGGFLCLRFQWKHGGFYS